MPETPAADGIPGDGLINPDEDEEISEVNDEDLEVDHEVDHDYHHGLVGRKIRAIYNNGWFTGNICWYNLHDEYAYSFVRG